MSKSSVFKMLFQGCPFIPIKIRFPEFSGVCLLSMVSGRLLKNLYGRKNPDFTFFYQVHHHPFPLVMKTFCPAGDQNISSQFLSCWTTPSYWTSKLTCVTCACSSCYVIYFYFSKITIFQQLFRWSYFLIYLCTASCVCPACSQCTRKELPHCRRVLPVSRFLMIFFRSTLYSSGEVKPVI